MGYPVVLTPQSQKDLQSIVRFIRRDSPQRAMSFGNLLIDKALSLGPFPEIGRVVPEIDDQSVREIIHGSYRIIYEVIPDPTTIYILRFWHAARGTPEIIRG
jgi:plasmid stabilization system protein ParE